MIRLAFFLLFLLNQNLLAFDRGSETGLPIPRWVSLKGDANLRYGPTTNAILFIVINTKATQWKY